MIFGIGAGWEASEFRMHGMPFPDIATRLAMLDEALQCMRGLWKGEPFDFAGKFYRFSGAVLLPKPLQTPHPPILLGGGGRGLLRLAARHADRVNIVVETGRDGRVALARMRELTDESFRAKVRFVRDQAEREGRDGRAITVSHMISTTVLCDSRAASRAAAERLSERLHLPLDAVPCSPALLVGTPEECILELRRRGAEWESAEVIFTLSGLGGAAGLRRLAEQVLVNA